MGLGSTQSRCRDAPHRTAPPPAMHTPYDIVWGLSIACYARWAMFGWQLSVHGTGGVCAAALLAPAGELTVCLLCGVAWHRSYCTPSPWRRAASTGWSKAAWPPWDRSDSTRDEKSILQMHWDTDQRHAVDSVGSFATSPPRPRPLRVTGAMLRCAIYIYVL
jgi:hypothetical protein